MQPLVNIGDAIGIPTLSTCGPIGMRGSDGLGMSMATVRSCLGTCASRRSTTKSIRQQELRNSGWVLLAGFETTVAPAVLQSTYATWQPASVIDGVVAHILRTAPSAECRPCAFLLALTFARAKPLLPKTRRKTQHNDPKGIGIVNRNCDLRATGRLS